MLNHYIKEIAIRIQNVHIIDLDSFRRIHFTQHGLHLNLRGKRKLSYIILDKLKISDTISPNNSNFASSMVPQTKENLTLQSPSNFTGQNPRFTANNHTYPKTEQPYKSALITSRIQLINADMKEIIDVFKNDGRIAFAHCISADFGCQKQMSEGVAVCFKEEFGKPTQSNLCCENLAFQQNNDEAIVYSLVTKPRFFNKPDLNVYNAAFLQLAEHFKSNKLQMLICSPLGCVRDRISPTHFAAQLVKFQQYTGAFIKIITKSENTRRVLRNGLTQNDFVNLLIRSVRVEAARSLNHDRNEEPTFSTPPARINLNSSTPSDQSSIPAPSSTTGCSMKTSSSSSEHVAESSRCPLFSASAEVSPMMCCEGGVKSSGVCDEVGSAVYTSDETNTQTNSTNSTVFFNIRSNLIKHNINYQNFKVFH